MLTKTTGVSEGILKKRKVKGVGHRLVEFVCGLLLSDRDRLFMFETVHWSARKDLTKVAHTKVSDNN